MSPEARLRVGALERRIVSQVNAAKAAAAATRETPRGAARGGGCGEEAGKTHNHGGEDVRRHGW